MYFQQLELQHPVDVYVWILRAQLSSSVSRRISAKPVNNQLLPSLFSWSIHGGFVAGALHALDKGHRAPITATKRIHALQSYALLSQNAGVKRVSGLPSREHRTVITVLRLAKLFPRKIRYVQNYLADDLDFCEIKIVREERKWDNSCFRLELPFVITFWFQYVNN